MSFIEKKQISIQFEQSMFKLVSTILSFISVSLIVVREAHI